jgi:hypothetical protein
MTAMTAAAAVLVLAAMPTALGLVLLAPDRGPRRRAVCRAAVLGITATAYLATLAAICWSPR